MPLTEPTSERDPEAWVLRFLAHLVLGLVAWHSIIWTMHPVLAAAFVPVFYFLAWEGAVQRFGAGFWDALADSVAVALGAGLGLEIMHTTPWTFTALLAAGAGAIYYGVWRRS